MAKANSIVPEWAESLPDELHGVAYLSSCATPEDFVSQVNNAAQHMGNSIRVPGVGATAEHWAKFREKVIARDPMLTELQAVDCSDESSHMIAELAAGIEAIAKRASEISSVDSAVFDSIVSIAQQIKSLTTDPA